LYHNKKNYEEKPGSLASERSIQTLYYGIGHYMLSLRVNKNIIFQLSGASGKLARDNSQF
jgi:hypothetical protein